MAKGGDAGSKKGTGFGLAALKLLLTPKRGYKNFKFPIECGFSKFLGQFLPCEVAE